VQCLPFCYRACFWSIQLNVLRGLFVFGYFVSVTINWIWQWYWFSYTLLLDTLIRKKDLHALSCCPQVWLCWFNTCSLHYLLLSCQIKQTYWSNMIGFMCLVIHAIFVSSTTAQCFVLLTDTWPVNEEVSTASLLIDHGTVYVSYHKQATENNITLPE
jgi:hypothetical protein